MLSGLPFFFFFLFGPKFLISSQSQALAGEHDTFGTAFAEATLLYERMCRALNGSVQGTLLLNLSLKQTPEPWFKQTSQTTQNPSIFCLCLYTRSRCWRSSACFAKVSFEFGFLAAMQVLQVWSRNIQKKNYPAFCPQQKVEKFVTSWRLLSWQDRMDSWALHSLWALKPEIIP